MKKFLFILGLSVFLSTTCLARPPYHHINHSYHKPIVRHHIHHKGWNTIGEITAGMMIGAFLVKDSYITYNQRVNVPQHCITLVNQNTGMITTQCAQDSNQVIYITE